MPFDGRGMIGYGFPMSRYEYLPKHWPDHLSFAVGWDPALDTYFAQVLDQSISQDDDCVIVWLGAMPPHYDHIDELMQALNRRILGRLHPVTLTARMRATLIRDREPNEEIPPPRKARGQVSALDLLGARPLAERQAEDEDH
jgi:hypothetical protein